MLIAVDSDIISLCSDIIVGKEMEFNGRGCQRLLQNWPRA